MKTRVMKYVRIALLVALAGCAGTARSCSGCKASTFGADWVVVQYRYDGAPISCWLLKDVSIANEGQSDGIYWKSEDGHLVHISGWYNRVQVAHGDYEGALTQLGLSPSTCSEGQHRKLEGP